MTTSTLVELFVAFGIGGSFLKVAELVLRRLFGRTSEQITDAERQVAIALDLVGPVHTELESARREARDLRREISEMRVDFEDLMEWARLAKRQLEDNGLTVPPMPHARISSN